MVPELLPLSGSAVGQEAAGGARARANASGSALGQVAAGGARARAAGARWPCPS